MKHYKRGETPKLYTTCKEETHSEDGSLSDGDLVNAASTMKIIIESCANGEIVQSLDTVTASANGLYPYSGYTIATNAITGKYHYSFRAADGSDTSKVADQDGYFIVDKEIV